MDARSARVAFDDIRFVDVREDYEYRAGHIDGSLHIPLGTLPSRVEELEGSDRVVTVCRSGARSDEAARFLRSFDVHAENLDGGVLAWTEAGFELVRPDGSPGRVMT